MTDYRYARATGALTAMTNFLVTDLERAIELIDDEYTIDRFKMTIGHAKQVLAQVDTDTLPTSPTPDYPADRTLANGDTKDGNTGEITPSTIDFEDNVNEPSKF